MTRADRAAAAAARCGSPAKNAPSGATRIAAPLPHDPAPPNAAAAATRHGVPSRIACKTTTDPGPYPRYGSHLAANGPASRSGSISP